MRRIASATIVSLKAIVGSSRYCARQWLKSVFVDGLFLGSADLFFGLKPVVEFRAGLVAAQDVEFVSSASDSFFAWKRFDWGFLCTGGCGHGITSGDHDSIASD